MVKKRDVLPCCTWSVIVFNSTSDSPSDGGQLKAVFDEP